jgi:protein TonB
VGHKDDRPLGRAMATSLLIHGGLVAAFVAAVVFVPETVRQIVEPMEYRVVFLPDPMPSQGGGGGGNPTPAPPKRLEIPEHKTPVAVPIPVVAPVEPPPVPVLNASIQTTNATVFQASGNNAASLANWGGGGRGRGLGPGDGSGVGPVSGGGFGGGAHVPGNGVTGPILVKEVKAAYTPEALKAKVQGEVVIDAVINENGVVGEMRVHKSLGFGLDEAAMEALRKWVFRPGMRQGEPVATLAQFALNFTLR